MSAVLKELWSNEYLGRALAAWLLAQFIKVVLNRLQTGRLDFERLVGSGGMPSAHSATVSALTVSIGRNFGWDSMYAALIIVVSLIVMYDAAGVRRATGEQAKLLNQIVAEFERTHQWRSDKLKELVGHTPMEVVVGALLGTVVGLF